MLLRAVCVAYRYGTAAMFVGGMCLGDCDVAGFEQAQLTAVLSHYNKYSDGGGVRPLQTAVQVVVVRVFGNNTPLSTNCMFCMFCYPPLMCSRRLRHLLDCISTDTGSCSGFTTCTCDLPPLATLPLLVARRF